MPRTKANTMQCDNDVKTIFRKFISHQKCTKNKKPQKYATLVSGSELNDWINQSIQNSPSFTSPVSPFKNEVEYCICHNLKTLINKPAKKLHINQDLTGIFCLPANDNPPVLINSINTTPSSTPSAIPCSNSVAKSISDYISATEPVKSDTKMLEGINSISLTVAGEQNETIDLTSDQYKMKRKSTKDVFMDNVLANISYKKPFSDLSMKQRQIRMSDLAAKVLGCCVNKKEFKSDTDNYLQKNHALAIDLLNLIDGMKKFIERKMKINLNEIEDIAMDPLVGDSQGHIGTLDSKNEDHKLAIALLGVTSRDKYTIIAKSMKQYHPIPSYHKLTKSLRPSISEIKYSLSSQPLNSNINTIQDTNLESTYQGRAMSLSGSATQEEEETRIIISGCNSDLIQGAKIVGDYNTYIKILEDKHRINGRDVDSANDVIFVLDSFDGAEHLRSKKSITSVISFSSSICSPCWMNNRVVTAGNSLNILTWQQIIGSESLNLLIPALESYFQKRQVLRPESRYHFYDIHGGKMLYLLTQHSLWNRKHKPFLLCSCQKRGEGVRNNNSHTCKLIPHIDQINHYKSSKDIFE